MRITAVFLTLVAVLAGRGGSLPSAVAIDWDDAGNSASKLWDDNGNWNPDGNPDGQTVNIGNLVNAFGDATLLDRAYVIDALNISNGASVTNSTDGGATNDFELIVNGPTTISGAGSTFFVIGGDPDGLDTEGLTINSGGTLNLNSTTSQGIAVVEIESGLLDLNSGGTIIGQGRIDFEDPAAISRIVFVNDGTLSANRTPSFFGLAPAAGTLRLNDGGNSNLRFDWDGAGTTAVINVNGNQTLDVDISTGNDGWSGTMNLRTGSTLDMRDAWSVAGGTINVNTSAFGLIIIGQDPRPGPAAVITGADWTMSTGTIELADTWDSLQFDSQLVASGGTINNSGTLIFNDGATILSGVDFNMNGAGAALVVNSTVNIDTPDFDLDGAQAVGNITTINAGGNLDLDLGAGADLSFGHTINMNGGELDVTSSTATSWALNTLGTINVAGGATSTINSFGETFNAQGRINVSDNATLNINSTTAYSSTASVSIEAGSTLNHATTSYAGGSYTGRGILRPGTATIAANTTWNVATADLDDGTITLNANLTVNADSIDDAGDGVDGTINISDTALLTVNMSGGGNWVVDGPGRINYTGNATPNSYLDGSDLLLNGILTHTGDGRIDARLTIGQTGVVDIATIGEPLRLSGGNTSGNANRIAGGTINGPGILSADGGSALFGFGTINADVDFASTADLRADDGVLTVNGTILDARNVGTFGEDGILNVPAPWNSSPLANVSMFGGEIRGGTLTIGNSLGVSGYGRLASRVVNNTQIRASSAGNTLVVETALNNNDWDGAAGNGTLRAALGTLELRDNAAFLFGGTVDVAASASVFANGFELEFEPGSTLNLAGGTYRSTNATDFGGAINATAGDSALRIAGSAVFEPTNVTTLTGNLFLGSPNTVVQAGATFAGGGILVNSQGSQLTLGDGASVNVQLENRGNLELGGGSAAQATVASLSLAASSTLNIDLAGLALGAIDSLAVSSTAQLGGELDLALLGGFVPTLGDTFTILTALSRLGTFDAVEQPLAMPADLIFDVVYNPTNVQLVVVDAPMFGADFDQDGDVDGDDLAQWEGDFGLNGDSDADGDLDSDGSDFLQWQQQFGSGVSAAAAAAAVPEPTGALLAGGIAVCLAFANRRRSVPDCQ
jgi:hypothetical protein